MKKDTPLFSCLRPADLLVCAVVLALAVLLLLLPILRGEGVELAITVDGETTIYSLRENRELTLSNDGYTLTVCIENGEAFVSSSNCPEGVCRRTGKISSMGETILCSRAGILLRVLGEGGYDAVAG